jgi:hypothetical protein
MAMKKLLFPFLVAAIAFSGCTKYSDSSRNSETQGRLSIKVTDDPFNISYVESATITISKIEIRKGGERTDTAFKVIFDDTVTLDLSKLRNGVTQELLKLDIPAGSYDQIRLYVDQASLKIKDQSSPFKLKIPSGSQSGIKIFISPGLVIEGGLTSELLLDFDLSKSFVMRGNLAHSAGVNGFIFKPCIRATNLTKSGRITGLVTDTAKVKIANAKVWIKQDTVMATAFTDTLGHYAIIGVPAGTYSIFANKENFDTVSFSGLKVIEGNVTVKDFVLKKK